MAAHAGVSVEEVKKSVAWKAVEYIKSGMVVGLGNGSNAKIVVDRIGQLLKEGQLKDIVGIPTSVETSEQARALGIPLSTLDDTPHIDVSIDGADEVDDKFNAVKGRGGLVLVDKMVVMAADKFICTTDVSKVVQGLGGSKLPVVVELVQFCHKYNMRRLQNLPELAGCEAKLRMEGDKPFVTMNGNYLVDLYFSEPIRDPHMASNAILGLVGVVEHGLFLDVIDVCIIGGPGGVQVREKSNNPST
eukprot:jgi/Chrzof1/10835/Cz05g13260.t1_RPI1